MRSPWCSVPGALGLGRSPRRMADCSARAWQIRETAANAGVVLAGENALPVFSPSGIDAVALERIVYNTRVRPKP